MSINWIGVSIVKRINDTARLLPFTRTGRAGGTPLEDEAPRRSAPGRIQCRHPWLRSKHDEAGPPEMKPQHHVHPTDDEAHHQQN